MSNYTLTYRKGRSQEIYIEEIRKDKKESPNFEQESPYFEQEYKDAIRSIEEIIILQGIGADDEKEDENKNGKKNNKRNIKKYGCNNRILFAGQRGCGKTSVMQSLAEYLSKNKINIKKNDDKKDDDKIRCYCLPMVDPSHFDNNNNILLTVITSMFSEAKKKMEKNSDKDEFAEREDLLKQFEKVFKSLDSIKSELSSYTLESLNRKSDAEDLRDKMNTLVSKFLKYVVGNNEARLVLLIDDIDMSVSYASEMLEQLRKYLELDNLIILMSANLGQLSNEMREKYSSAFQYTLKDSNQALSIDVEDLATKYLLKLFPTSRRINVERHTSQLLDTKLIIKESSNEVAKNDIEGDFQKVILSLIWNKTRLLFIPKDPVNTLHPIIPKNLRDLAQFLDMLTALQNVGSVYEYKKNENDKETIKESRLFAYKNDYDICEHNLQVFKNYFMKTWIPNHLIVGEELVFHNIPTDITEINKHLINSINIIGTNHKDDLMSRQVGLDIIEKNADNVFIDRDIYTMVSPNDPKFVKANKISDIFNQPSNYSYGDLLLMIDKYETYFESEEHRKFTDAIKIYYSILLFETMFFKSQDVEYKYEEGNEYEVIPIQKLIGGNVYYPNYFEIITDKNFNQKGPSFDAKRAFYHKVKVDSKHRVGDKYPLFSVLYYGDIRPDRYEKDHIYDTTFKKNAEIDGTKYVTFDILSILNNMLNPCHTLSRLDDMDYRPKNDWNSIISNIKNWGEYINIKNDKEENSTSTPNVILPFYAVDLMLKYLRHDCSTDDLFKKSSSVQKPETRNAQNVADSINIFFDDSPINMIDVISIMKSILYIKEQNDNISNNKYLSEQDKTNIENIINKEKKSSISQTEKNTLNKIVNKIFVTIFKVKGLIEEIAKKTVSSPDDNNSIVEVAEYIFLTVIEYKGQLERISQKDKVSVKDVDSILKRIAEMIPIVIECKNRLNIIVTSDEVKSVSEAVVECYGKLEKIVKPNLNLSNFQNQSLKDIAAKKKKTDKDKLILSVFCTMSEIDLNNISLLIENIEIIKKAHKCFKDISLNGDCKKLYHEDSLTDLYRNHVTALIFGKTLMTNKEKDGLVKELHKYTSVSEIYKHLVDVLWKNAITEICIRGRIQERVRSFEVVQTYYGKLWEETQKMFKLIEGVLIEDNELKSKPISIVYENLFKEANKYFLNNALS